MEVEAKLQMEYIASNVKTNEFFQFLSTKHVWIAKNKLYLVKKIIDK